MLALLPDPTPPHDLAIGEAPEPRPAATQLVVEIRAISLNYGEVAYRTGDSAYDGQPDIPGLDASGIVVRAAADGSGPAVDTPVVCFGYGGAWAQRRAVDVANVAVVPDGVDLVEASALPAAGVTALRAVRRLGSVLSRRVLVTGASGGVGRYAVQLLALSGAEVVASVGSPGRGAGLTELGAREVVIGVDRDGPPFDGVLDNVGGDLLTTAMGRLADGGTALSIGMASGSPTTLDFEVLRRQGPGRSVEVFVVGDGFGADLTVLLDLAARGRLDLQVGRRGGWEEITEFIDGLLSRRITGKAVLEVR